MIWIAPAFRHLTYIRQEPHEMRMTSTSGYEAQNVSPIAKFEEILHESNTNTYSCESREDIPFQKNGITTRK